MPNPASGPSRLRAFLATGVCGGLTTFSTMQRELLEMIDGGRTYMGVYVWTQREQDAARKVRNIMDQQ